MYRRLPREYIIVFCIIVVAVVLSMSQTILYRLQVPNGFVYPYVHNFVEDYYYYLHIMRQGWEGSWFATTRFTAEQFAPQFIVVFLLFLGQSARILHVSLPVMYTIARIGGAFILFSLVYYLCHTLWPTERYKRITGLIVVLFGTYWWGWNAFGPVVPSLVHEWTVLDPLFRASYIPHHLWSKIFMLISFILLASKPKKKERSTFLFLFISVVCMGLSSPKTLVTFLMVIIPWGIYEIFKTSVQNNKRYLWIRWGISGILSIMLLVYNLMIERSVFPWTTYQAWEGASVFIVTIKSYIQTIGPTGFLFFIGMPFLFTRNSLERILVIWALVPFFELFVIGRLRSFNAVLFLDNYEFIPLGIGAVEGVSHGVRMAVRNNTRKYFALYVIVIGLLCAYFLVGLYASWREHVSYVTENKVNDQVYIPREYIKAFQYLNAYSKNDQIILAPYAMGTMIPAFTGYRVIAGHALNTFNVSERQKELQAIYDTGDSAVLHTVLTQDDVGYVWIPESVAIRESVIEQGYKSVYSNARVSVLHKIR